MATFGECPEDVLVFGWYGTETAGDKAILAEILHRIFEKEPGADVTVASMYPYHSEWTLEELGYGGVEVIPTYSREFLSMCRSVDEVVMGGGPLMHIGALGFVLKAFLTARKAGVQTRIAGCGIGPLDGEQKYTDAVRAILNLADQIELRNDDSVREAERLCGRTDITNGGDPAFGFVHRWMKSNDPKEGEEYLNLYLREWPQKYAGDRTEAEYRETRESFEQELGTWIEDLSSSTALVPRLLPMHHFHVGNDDRAFARRFAKEQLSGIEYEVEKRPLTLSEILRTMREGELSVCMRYHSVGFANELGEDFYAIDYSLGGKVRRYLEERGDVTRSRTVPEIAAGEWRTLPRYAKQ
jgi:polysaccharide pyruvyl transferase WcaK-like protein